MGRENSIAACMAQNEFTFCGTGRNVISMTRKSKEKEESILKAKILGFLVSYLAEAYSLCHREGWQRPTKTADQEFPKHQPASQREKVSEVLTPKIMLIHAVNFKGHVF